MSKHGRPCGQRPEPLPLRLRNLLRDLSVFKASSRTPDDARATEVPLDPRLNIRQHTSQIHGCLGSGQAHSSPMTLFSTNDREHIETIGASSKTKGGPKIGRFGLGFNTVSFIPIIRASSAAKRSSASIRTAMPFRIRATAWLWR